MRRLSIALVVLYLLVLFPDVAHACAVCFDPKDENRVAFLATTIFLSAVPLGMAGGLGLWLRKRARELRGLPTDDLESPEE